MSLPSPAQDHFFDSKSVRLRFTLQGLGEPIVLLHGFLGDIETSWIGSPYGPQPNILPALARHYQVIGLDMRGHGKSDKPHAPDQYGEELAADVIRLLDHLGLNKAHLVSYSLGALIAGKVLASSPARLNRVVLGGGGVYAQSLFSQGKAPEDEAMAAELEQGQGITSYLLTAANDGQPMLTPEQAKSISDFVLANKDITALVALARSLWCLGISDAQLRANRVPTLAVIGTRDEGRERVEALRTRMANLSVREVRGADHLSTLAHPAFLQAIEEFQGNGG